MAKPYRRRKGKRGPFVGNFRVTINGRDLNLGTKDAEEAHARARLAVQGKWPPDEAAARAAVAMLDPGADDLGAASAAVPADAEPAGAGASAAASASAKAAVGAPPQVPGTVASSAPSEPLEAAAAAAAGDAAGVDAIAPAETIERERSVDAELAGVMAELSSGGNGADLLDGVCDGVAAGLLWMERKSIELGWKWMLVKRTGKLLETDQPPPDSLMRKSLKVGLKGMAVIHFPDFASKLTPGWAIAIGLVGGAGQAVAGGRLVDAKDPTKVMAVADAMAEAQRAEASGPVAAA